MQINADLNASAYSIKSYEVGEVSIFEPISKEAAKEAYETGIPPSAKMLKLTQSAIISANTLIKDWGPKKPQELNIDDFQKILDLRPEVVILGTGKNIHFPNPKDMLLLQQEGIGVEVMGTAAACRTYNFLMSDGRDVACAIFMLEDS